MKGKDTLKNVLAGIAVVGIIAGGTLGIAKLVNDKQAEKEPETEQTQTASVEFVSVPELI